MNTTFKPKTSFARQFFSAIILGIGLVAALVILWILAIYILFAGRVLPGVTLNGTSLAGSDLAQTKITITSTYTFPQTGHILLQESQQKWIVTPSQLGVYLDTVGSARNALAVGRSGSLFARLGDLFQTNLFGYNISPTFIFDQRVALQYLTDLAHTINQPMEEAGLSIENTQVTISQGQPGRVLDIATSLQAISLQLQKMQDGIVLLVVQENQPKVLDVSQLGELVKSILSQPFSLTLPSGQTSQKSPWTIEPVDLARLLSFTEVQEGQGTNLQIRINKTLMAAYLRTLEKDINQNPQNSRFTFNDDTHLLEVVQAAVVGRVLDIDKSVDTINDAILKGEHTAILQVSVTDPQIKDTTTGAELGITELVSDYTSYFRGSSPERVHNIQTAAKSFYGLMLAPGATLSMSDVLGNISLDNGYAEALIIVGDQTITGVGGGVCQVSTTLFRTAFLAGFPIVERYPHAYRVGYYDQDASGHTQKYAGLDATVFVPIVDFKFTNDTPYWLLMETYVSPTYDTLEWKFYSTKDGRVVNWESTGLTDIVEPPATVYIENPDLPSGTKKQTDYAVQGATVVVNRTVTRDGQVITTDRFYTKYEAWPDIYEYGPGTEGIPTPTPTP